MSSNEGCPFDPINPLIWPGLSDSVALLGQLSGNWVNSLTSSFWKIYEQCETKLLPFIIWSNFKLCCRKSSSLVQDYSDGLVQNCNISIANVQVRRYCSLALSHWYDVFLLILFSWYWNCTVCWHSSHLAKTNTCIIPADALVIQGAKASIGMLLTP